MDKIIGVYIIKNKVNNKFYVSHSINIYRRFDSHKSYLNRGIHHCLYLQRAWNKYGEKNFEFIIIKECISEAESIKLEQYYIDNYTNYLYNTSNIAAFGGDLLTNNPNKEKIIEKRVATQRKLLDNMSSSEKISKFARKGSNNGMYGKTHTDEVKKKISLINTGKEPINKGKKLEETVGLEKDIAIKKHLSELGKAKTGSKNPFYGKKHSDDSKDKMRKKNLGKKPVNMRKVKIDNTVYESVTDASRHLNVCAATIIYRIKSANYKEYIYLDT